MRGKTAPAKTPFETAVAMLSRRPYSVGELRRALERKFPDSTDLAGVLARLRQLGYLDDAKFAEAYASSLARVRNYGRHRVRRELKSKLVDYRVIERAVDNAFTSVNERELLERIVDKKTHTLRKPMTRSRLASLCQSLIRRGFRADDIMRTIRSRPELTPVADGVVIQNAEVDDEKL